MRTGPAAETLHTLCNETGAKRVVWNRRYEPVVVQRDTEVKRSLDEAGIETESFNGGLLNEPWTVKNQEGAYYKVFTPYYKACLKLDEPAEPLLAPTRIPAPKKWPESDSIDDLGLEPTIDWAGGIRDAWTPGEAGAWDRVLHFRDELASDYAEQRNRPDIDGVSRMSPYLHFGEISPRQIWHAMAGGITDGNKGVQSFIREVYWREFSYNLLFNEPHTPDAPLRPEFADFPWRGNADALKAWQRGKTGYPYIDAGMRELWATGWMHNRVRMATASFLVKDLLVPWQDGARWFWDTLVDADLANNTMGWQMDGRLRRGRSALLPHFQSNHAGQEVRS